MDNISCDCLELVKCDFSCRYIHLDYQYLLIEENDYIVDFDRLIYKY